MVITILGAMVIATLGAPAGTGVVTVIVGSAVGKGVGAIVGEFVGFVTTGASTSITNPVEASKLDEMAVVVAELDNVDAMLPPDTAGGVLTTYDTEIPTIVNA